MRIPVNIYLRSLPVIGILSRLGYKVEQKGRSVVCKTGGSDLLVVQGGLVRPTPYAAWDTLSFVAGRMGGDYEKAFDWIRREFGNVIGQQAGLSVDFLKHELIAATQQRMLVLQSLLSGKDASDTLAREHAWVVNNAQPGIGCCAVTGSLIGKLCGVLGCEPPVQKSCVLIPAWASPVELCGAVLVEVGHKKTIQHTIMGDYEHGWAGDPRALLQDAPVLIDVTLGAYSDEERKQQMLRVTTPHLLSLPGTGSQSCQLLQDGLIVADSASDQRAFAAGLRCARAEYAVGANRLSQDSFIAAHLASHIKNGTLDTIPAAIILGSASSACVNELRSLVDDKGMEQLARVGTGNMLTRRLNKANTLHMNEQGATIHKADGTAVSVTNFNLRLETVVVYEDLQDIVYTGTASMDGKVQFQVRFSKKLLSKPADLEATLAVAAKGSGAITIPSITDKAGWRYVSANLALDAAALRVQYGQDVMGWSKFGRKFTLPGYEFDESGCRKEAWLPHHEYPALKEYWEPVNDEPTGEGRLMRGNSARLVAYMLGSIMRSRCNIGSRRDPGLRVSNRSDAAVISYMSLFGQTRTVEGAHNDRATLSPAYLRGLPFACREGVDGIGRVVLSDDGLLIEPPGKEQLCLTWMLCKQLIGRLILEDQGILSLLQSEAGNAEKLGFAIWAKLHPQSCPDIMSRLASVLDGTDGVVDFAGQTVLIPGGMEIDSDMLDALAALDISLESSVEGTKLMPADKILEHFDIVQKQRPAP